MRNPMEGQEKKNVGILPLFDPQKGTTVLEPTGKGSGYWVGAPSVIYDEEVSEFYLYYRVREPRPIRGGECYIAASKDGEQFTDIWRAKKKELNSSSVEKSSLVKTLEGKYRLYISYVDSVDHRWRIDMIEAPHPADFSITKRERILTASSAQCEGVKDPYVLIVGRKYYMMVSYASASGIVDEKLRDRMHATGDAYNTGLVKSCTGLALSSDGVNFSWQGDILSPGQGWDAYTSRISCVLYVAPVFTAFYDGSSSVGENYEEKTGLAISFDLMHYDKVTEEKPILISPYGSGALRYVDGIIVENNVYYYYEYAREDGSHELRMNKVALVDVS